MFLPTTHKEMQTLGWECLDVIFVSGDTYIDSPYTGVALLGKLLVEKGFRVGVIAQPDITNDADIKRLGEPRLFWGVTSGSVDSMVANYTATKKWRKSDDYTPGGMNNRRPDRAVIAYTNLIRRYFKGTCPIVIGGIEASLRRIAHFDFWSNKIRRSILFDAKADILAYGMAEATVVELARALDQGRDVTKIRGLCYISKTITNGYIELPSFEKSAADKQEFSNGFRLFYANNDPVTAKGLGQQHGDRFLIQNPPQPFPSTPEMDEIYNLEFEREAHPFYTQAGKVKALDTIRFSIPTHRGCYGECNFCAIAVHEGRTVRWRSRESIINEARALTRHPRFRGIITDIGGPTANMYGFECKKKYDKGACPDKRCLFPKVCQSLKPDHSSQIELLRQIRTVPGVKKVFIASGIRQDLIFADKSHGMTFLKTVVAHHVSGQMKIAPEHTETKILELMGKPDSAALIEFKAQFDRLSKENGKQQFLTYYLIAAHPGSTMEDMKKLKQFCSTILKIRPEQTQIFTPTPSTFSTLMYYTGTDPFSGKPLFVERNPLAKEGQKNILTGNRKRK
ncbi:putative Fe-S oxidoreductase family protein [Desulforapulum autotrophicum HRM2]|uniref:Fe-S oxidoreductase family protein n=1 Tax=Desulforapulum autotrophicum (strain ATCC 43914 / DSM 3382 / VKM B-1955 / HRM2) TaxID=177437 RepID=C0QM91_DESAH|nr:YgiQ family radical SAM protein [Desulforapulum autotrophicum]ACN16408.1 putative Fe-S oxidoreductase family protein [Desulforapulum autotrophicum HRM2]